MRASFEKQVTEEFVFETALEDLPLTEQYETDSALPFTRTTNCKDSTAGKSWGSVDNILGMLTYLKAKLAEDMPLLPGYNDTLTNDWDDIQLKMHGGTVNGTVVEDDAAD